MMSDERWGRLASAVNGQWLWDERLEIVAEMDRLRTENAALKLRLAEAERLLSGAKPYLIDLPYFKSEIASFLYPKPPTAEGGQTP